MFCLNARQRSCFSLLRKRPIPQQIRAAGASLGRKRCETRLPFDFKWQPNIATRISRAHERPHPYVSLKKRLSSDCSDFALTNIIAIDRDQENSGIRCRIYRGWRRTSEVTCFLWSGSGRRRRPLELFRYRRYNYVSIRQDDCEKQMFDPAVSGISDGNEPMRDGLLAKFNGFDGAVVRPLMKAQHPPHGAIYYFLTA